MAITIRKNSTFTDLLQKNLKSRYEDKRRVDNIVHVSDIIPTTCIRKQYYSRKFPELDPLSNESVHHFVRGESSEFVITELASLGVAQATIEMDGIVAHPDIMNEVEDVIVELKDTVNGKRLDITDDTFRAYLRQLLYYLVMTGIEKGIISIRYNIRELRWIKSDSEGNDYFFRPFNAKDVGIESWEIHLPATDVAREILKNEMVRRKNLFLKALEENDVSILPRLPEFARKKCSWCPFYDKCMNKDNETDKAKEMSNEIDILDISGVVDFKPVVENSDR
jgi:CRISPR/Cas system-associated exonuclease Cas4 (RecB family)